MEPLEDPFRQTCRNLLELLEDHHTPQETFRLEVDGFLERREEFSDDEEFDGLTFHPFSPQYYVDLVLNSQDSYS